MFYFLNRKITMRDNFEESKKNEPSPSFFKSLPKPQRTAFLFLSALSLGVIVLWVWQFHSRLTSPFSIPGSNNTENSLNTDDFMLALSNMDSDGDGLTDNEETNLYGTSPFLEDSDSDGISDRAEIENGTNPNCAPGQQCNVQDIPVLTTTASNTATISTATVTVTADSGNSDSLQAMMSGQANAAQLRALLLDSGADAGMLQQLSDEDLIETYQEMLAGQSGVSQ